MEHSARTLQNRTLRNTEQKKGTHRMLPNGTLRNKNYRIVMIIMEGNQSLHKVPDPFAQSVLSMIPAWSDTFVEIDQS